MIREQKQNYGRSMKNARTHLNISTYVLEKKHALSRLQIQNIESGIANYTIDTLLDYNRAFKLFPFVNNQIAKDKTAIGKALMNLRKEKDLSKYRVSKESGVSANTIADIESGTTNYTIDNYLALLDFYNLEFRFKKLQPFT